MDIREAAIRAYGELWQDLSGSRRANDARKFLKDSLTDAERAQGIAWANEKNGQVTETDVLSAADMVFGEERT